MADSSQFTIDIAAKAAGVDQAADAVDRLAKQLSGAQSAAAQAAEAVSAGEASYKAAETAADGAAKALERISLKAVDLQSKMQAAADAGDERKYLRLASAAEELAQRHVEASAKVDAAKAALNNEAAALDGLRAAAKSASDQESQFAKAHEAATKNLGRATAAADKMRSSQGHLAESTGKALTGLKKFGGPVGRLADTAEDSIEGFTKMAEEIGTVGTVAALSVVAVVALAAAAAGLAYGLGKVTFWAVQLADKEKRLDSISAKFKKHTQGLFGGLKIKPLLDGVEDLVDLFDETTVTGKAIKVVFESMFQPLIDGVVAFIPKMRTAFIQFEILVLKALIAIKPFGSQILMVAKVVGVLAAIVVGVLVAAFAAGFAIMIAFWTVVIKLGQAMQWVTETVTGLGKSIYDYFANTSLTQMGTDLITGLANGILGAGPAVLSALGGVVGGAIDSAKKLLGIASPSKVFAEIGAYTAEGMAVGVDSGTSGVQGSLENLVAPPAAPTNPASGGSGSSANLAGATFIFNGVQGAEDAVGKFEELLTRFAEGDLAQLGQAVPA